MTNSKNPFDLEIGSTVTAYNRGIHRITDMWEDGDSIRVEYQQVFTVDGAPINMITKYECDIKDCRPAIMLVPQFKKRIQDMSDFIRIIEKEFKNG